MDDDQFAEIDQAIKHVYLTELPGAVKRAVDDTDLREALARALCAVEGGRIMSPDTQLAERYAIAAEAVVRPLLEAKDAEIASLKAKLDMPCGSCHPCRNWTSELWTRAAATEPSPDDWNRVVKERDEARHEVAELKGWQEDVSGRLAMHTMEIERLRGELNQAYTYIGERSFRGPGDRHGARARLLTSEAHSSVAKGQSELDATLDLAPCCGRLADGRHPLNCRQRCQDCEGDPDGPTPCRCRPEPAVPEQAQPREPRVWHREHLRDDPSTPGEDEIGLKLVDRSGHVWLHERWTGTQGWWCSANAEIPPDGSLPGGMRFWSLAGTYGPLVEVVEAPAGQDGQP